MRGLTPPRFQPATAHPGATRAALVQDPAGHWVELVIVPGASADALARFEIGLAVADLARSRAFYRDLMGLEALWSRCRTHCSARRCTGSGTDR